MKAYSPYEHTAVQTAKSFLKGFTSRRDPFDLLHLLKMPHFSSLPCNTERIISVIQLPENASIREDIQHLLHLLELAVSGLGDLPQVNLERDCLDEFSDLKVLYHYAMCRRFNARTKLRWNVLRNLAESLSSSFDPFTLLLLYDSIKSDLIYNKFSLDSKYYHRVLSVIFSPRY